MAHVLVRSRTFNYDWVADEECADFEDDSRLARRKRRRVANQSGRRSKKYNAQVEEQVDEDYDIFLKRLQEYGDQSQDFCDNGLVYNGDDDPDYRLVVFGDGNTDIRSVDDGDNNGHVRSLNDHLNDKDVDPQCKIFLENVRADGKSYALEIVLESGITEVIKYEPGHGLLQDGPNLDTPETLENSQVKEKTKVTRILRKGLMRETLNHLNKSTPRLKKVESENPRAVRRLVRNKKWGTMENLKDIPKKKSSVVKNNVQEEALKEKTDTKRTTRLIAKKKKIKINSPDKSARLVNNEEIESANEKVAEGRTKGRFNKRPGSEVIHFAESDATEEAYQKFLSGHQNDGVNEKAAGGSTNGCSKKIDGSEVLQKCGSNHRAESIVTDESYQRFLDNLKNDGENLVYTPKNGQPVVLEKDVESSPDVEILMEGNPCDGFKAVVDLETGRCIESPGTGHSQFRMGIMKDLKRPYDQEEYDKLLKDVYCRTPKFKDRDLRSVTKQCIVQGQFGKSYLEKHTGLAIRINEAKGNFPKILNLLRGFFYWLKNGPQEGSFMPWNDPSCLNMLPPVDKENRCKQGFLH